VDGLPAVGDWVAVRDRRIHAVLPRRTAVTRRTPGTAAHEQVLAANVDLVVVVVAPGRDANPRRVERLLALAWESGGQPVVVLGRADLCPEWGTDVATELAGLAAVAPGVRVLALSCYTGEGVDEIAAMLAPAAPRSCSAPPGSASRPWSTAWPAATCWPPARSGTTARAATPPPPVSWSSWPAAAW
jgi:ribosome biogenesis GTPase